MKLDYLDTIVVCDPTPVVREILIQAGELIQTAWKRGQTVQHDRFYNTWNPTGLVKLFKTTI